MNLKTKVPVTMLYRGDLYDTAALFGLANMGISVRLIAFIGELKDESKNYCESISEWLRAQGMPAISIHPNMLNTDLEHIIDRPHRDWGWKDAECVAALRLGGLPFPPDYKPKPNEKEVSPP